MGCGIRALGCRSEKEMGNNQSILDCSGAILGIRSLHTTIKLLCVVATQPLDPKPSTIHGHNWHTFRPGSQRELQLADKSIGFRVQGLVFMIVLSNLPTYKELVITT